LTNEQQTFDREEAWQQVQHHFTEQGGLIDQIERGEVIKETTIQEVQRALATVEDDWKTQHTIPRQKVALLWSIFPRLEKAIQRDRQREQALRFWRAQLTAWLHAVFASPSPPMSEEEAIAVVFQHMVGGPSFALTLRQGNIDEPVFQHLLQKMNELELLWQNKPDIPKRAAGVLITLELLPWSSETCSAQDQQKLMSIKHILHEKINGLLKYQE